MVPKTCSVDGCEKPGTRKKMCDMHYRRFRNHGDPLITKMPGRGKSPTERLDMHTDKSGECWIFTGSGQVYGKLDVNGRSVSAHRMAYERANGPVPSGLVVRHKCDNTKCVRASHLELGTNADNSRDMTDRERQARGERQGSAKLTEAQVLEIRNIAAGGNVRHSLIAKQFGVSQAQIGHIVTGRRWKYLLNQAEEEVA